MLLGPKLTDWIDETPLSLFVCVKKKKKKGSCSLLFPVFSSANCSCVSIYVKPPVHVSPHPNARFLQWTCSCLLHDSLEPVSLASRYIFTVQADQQVCTALQKNPTFSLSVTFSIFLCQMHSSLSLSLSISLCLSFSIIVSLFPTLRQTYQEASTLYGLMSTLGYLPDFLLLRFL